MTALSHNASLESLQAQLDSADPAVRRVVLREVADACTPELLPLVDRALGDGAAQVRLEAVTALDAIGGAECVAPLIRALADADAQVRELAAQALAENQSPQGAPALLEALHASGDVWTIAALLEALKPLRSAAALQPSLLLLSHADAGVRAAAASVIGYLRLPQAAPELLRLCTEDAFAAVRLAALRALISAPPETLAAAAVKALTDAEWIIRAEAATMLGKLRHNAAADALAAVAAGDPHWQVREQAVEALGLLRHQPAAAAIAACLQAPVSNLRKAAVIALGRIGDRSLRRQLAPLRDDPDAQVRKLAVQVLEQLERG